MRRFLVIAGTVLAFGGVSATGAVAAQPGASCQATVGPAFPGNTANAPGSAFNGSAGSVYASSTDQGGTSASTVANNPKTVSQYDVACTKQPSP